MGSLQERDLLDVLCDINFRMNNHGGKIKGNVLERYQYFIDHSEHGKRCSYAQKYKEMLLRYDFDTLRDLIMEASEMLKDMEPR